MDLRIECFKKKYQPSSLSGVRSGSWAIQFLAENHGAKYFCMERSNFSMEQSVFDYVTCDQASFLSRREGTPDTIT